MLVINDNTTSNNSKNPSTKNAPKPLGNIGSCSSNFLINGSFKKIRMSGNTINNKIYNVSFVVGCNGNLKAVSSLVEGQNIDTVIKRLKGITCNSKQTSCGDQLATALQEVKNELQ